MKTQLQNLRKKAGYKSARKFAEHYGMSVSTYTQYEQGTRSMSLETACEFADMFSCTLDELVGREFHKSMSVEQATLNANYESMSEESKAQVVAMAAGLARIDKNASPKNGVQNSTVSNVA